jgi:hypothetical protein
MKSVIVSLSLLLSTPAVAAETIIIPVQDLLMTIPNFDNAPDFNLNDALNGGMPVGNSKPSKRQSKREQEKKLIELVQDMYPDATVRLWNGNLIVRIP